METLKAIKNDKRGEIFVELIIKLLMVVIIILFALNVFDVVIKYQHVTYTAKSIAKVVEQEGALNDVAYQKLDDLNDNFNTHATFDISNVRYFNAMDRSIQFRDSFEITVSDSYDLTILSPVFAPPLVLDIPMAATITGMSEVYYK